jgi:hypothetical protein
VSRQHTQARPAGAFTWEKMSPTRLHEFAMQLNCRVLVKRFYGKYDEKTLCASYATGKIQFLYLHCFYLFYILFFQITLLQALEHKTKFFFSSSLSFALNAIFFLLAHFRIHVNTHALEENNKNRN